MSAAVTSLIVQSDMYCQVEQELRRLIDHEL